MADVGADIGPGGPAGRAARGTRDGRTPSGRAAAAEARAAAAERRAALLGGLVAATRALIDAPTFEAGLAGWLAALADVAGADRAAFGSFAGAPGTDAVDAVAYLAVWARPGMPDLVHHAIPRTADYAYAAERVLAGRVYTADRAGLRDARSRAYWDAHGIGATIVVPVRLGARVWGWFYLDYADARGRQAADEAVLRAASDGVSVAVRREEALRAALAERAARERAERARAAELAETNARLARSMTRLTGEGSPDAFVYQLHRELCDLLGGAATSQHEIRGDRGVGGIVIDAGASGDVERVVPWQREECQIWRAGALREDEIQRLDFPRDAALMTDDATGYLRAHELTWFLRLPLFVGGAPRWMVTVSGRDASRLTEPNLALFRTLARQLTLALELRRLAEAGRQAAVAEERNALAREVHDTLAQGLSGIVMQLGAARAQLGPAAAAAPALDRVERLARAHLTEARRSIAALRPGRVRPDAGGGGAPGGGQRSTTRRVPAGRAPLEAALRAAVRTASDAAAGAVPGTTPDVTLAVHGVEPPIPAEVEIELLRIAQAAVANALAHANARRIAVDLAYLPAGGPAGSTAPPSAAPPASVRIGVADDGRGFDPDAPRPGRYGLDGMCERAARVGAELTLVTAPGEGTEVVVMWRVGAEGGAAGAAGHT
jgi:signal transduction histidine kinase